MPMPCFRKSTAVLPVLFKDLKKFNIPTNKIHNFECY